MSRQVNKLSATAFRNAKPRDKTLKMADGGGLYLEISPTGSKYWRLKYRFAGKEKRLAIGVYSGVSLVKPGLLVTKQSASWLGALTPARPSASLKS